MFRVVLYGLGKFSQKWIPMIIKEIRGSDIDIVAVSDKKIEKRCEGFYDDIPAVSQKELHSMEYDLLVILAGENIYSDICDQLINCMGIPKHKIGSVNNLLKVIQRSKGIGRNVVQEHPVRIYDCFPFFNEIDILHIRMKLLDPYVDYFVIVELNQSHRGVKKPYYFEQHRGEFSEYQDKIIYIQPEDIPSYKGDGDWTIENYQRNCILRGLKDCGPEDVIGISDCDEIPDPEIYRKLRSSRKSLQHSTDEVILDSCAVSLEQDFCYYFFNCVHKIKWYGSVLVKYKNLITPQFYREMRNVLPFVKRGGWHFTYFGSAEKNKLKSCSTVDGIDVTEEEIRNRIASGIDIYGRQGEEYQLEVVDYNKMNIPGLKELIVQYPQYYREPDERH